GTMSGPLASSLFASPLWLEMKIGVDTPLTPRQPFVSVAHAFKADSVKDGSITASSLASGTLNNLSWLLGGNAATNPASQFIGTTDNQPLVFRTNNVERMRLTTGTDLGLQLPGNNFLELGQGVAGKEQNAGRIAYK